MNYVSLQGEIAIVNIDLFCSVLYEGGTHWIPPPEFASQDDITKFSDHNCCVSLYFCTFYAFSISNSFKLMHYTQQIVLCTVTYMYFHS